MHVGRRTLHSVVLRLAEPTLAAVWAPVALSAVAAVHAAVEWLVALAIGLYAGGMRRCNTLLLEVGHTRGRNVYRGPSVGRGPGRDGQVDRSTSRRIGWGMALRLQKGVSDDVAMAMMVRPAMARPAPAVTCVSAGGVR